MCTLPLLRCQDHLPREKCSSLTQRLDSNGSSPLWSTNTRTSLTRSLRLRSHRGPTLQVPTSAVRQHRSDWRGFCVAHEVRACVRESVRACVLLRKPPNAGQEKSSFANVCINKWSKRREVIRKASVPESSPTARWKAERGAEVISSHYAARL